MAKIFISYTRKDGAEVAAELAKRLRQIDHTVFRDIESIVGGEEWRQELHEQIMDCDAVILIVTEGTFRSEYVYEEIELAKYHQKTIIPIQITTDLPPFVRKYHALILEDNNYDAAMLKIVLALQKVKDRFSEAPTPPLPDPQKLKSTAHTVQQSRPKSTTLVLGLVGIVTVIVLGVFILWQLNNDEQTANTTISPSPDIVSPSPDLDTPTTEPPPQADSAELATEVYIEVTSLGAYIYAGPNVSFGTIGTIVSAERLTITGISADEEWYRVIYQNQEGWIRNRGIFKVSGNTSSLPIIQSPPTYTPDASNTPFPTYTPRPTEMSSVFTNLERSFKDDFSGNTLSLAWRGYGNRPYLDTGLLIYEKQSNYDSWLSTIVPKEAGIILLFQYEEAGILQIGYEAGDWKTDTWKAIAIHSDDRGEWRIGRSMGSNSSYEVWVTSFSLEPNTWYYLAIYNNLGEINFAIWDRNTPAEYLVKEAIFIATEWDRSYNFIVKPFGTTFKADYFERFKVSENFELPETPPTLQN